MKTEVKRRSFLGMIGAAVATPALPAMGGGAAGVTYSRSAYGMAVLHARTRHHVSARGIAHCLKVTLPQAKAMITEMSAGGLVKPVVGGAGVHVRAVSNILQPSVIGMRTAGIEAKKRAAQRAQEAQRTRTARAGTGQNAMVGHLHHMCVASGHTLNPRCAMQYGIAT